MNDPHRRPDDLVPVPCPACEQAQNSLPGDFSLDAASFGPVVCIVCGHEFSREEYLRGRAQRLAAWPPLRAEAGPH